MYLRLIKTRDGGYAYKDSDSKKLGILSLFLLVDVEHKSLVDCYRDWILNQQYEDTAGNITFIEKENDKITIGKLFVDDPYEVVFETTQEQFLKILDQWEELCKSKPKEIIIKKEGGIITLTGKN